MCRAANFVIWMCNRKKRLATWRNYQVQLSGEISYFAYTCLVWSSQDCFYINIISAFASHMCFPLVQKTCVQAVLIELKYFFCTRVATMLQQSFLKINCWSSVVLLWVLPFSRWVLCRRAPSYGLVVSFIPW